MAVTFASSGYGGVVTQSSWADLATSLGHSYAVEDVGSWAVAPGVGDRAITIAPGTGYGFGVKDTTVDIESMFLPAVTSGASRYDMIVARRNWATKTTTFAIVPGNVNRVLPGRPNNPGFLDEQPLCLVKVNAGSTAIAEITDLRVWATDGGMVARDALVRTYLGRLGARLKINGETWSFDYISAGWQDWVNEDASGPWVPLTLGSGWVNNGASVARARVVGRGAFLHVQADVRYVGGSAVFEGWVIAALPAGMRPIESSFVPGTTNSYRSGAIYSVNATGITVGPYPVGTICHFNGLASLK